MKKDNENHAPTKIVELMVPRDIAAERLDRYLGHITDLELSRTRIQRLIDAGLITVDNNKATNRQKLSGGETIQIAIPPPAKSELEPEDIPLDVVFEDEYLLIVDKPAGMVTHPGAGNFQGTLVNALLYYSRELSAIGGLDRPGIVHRLDRDTSGLLMIAKNDDIHLRLQKEMQERKVEKKYLALICGHLKAAKGVIDMRIGRSSRERKKMTVLKTGGRESLTEYLLLERYRLYDFLEVTLHTGRTHQIRVHFSHLGHPVFGDSEYGGRQKWHRGIFTPDRLLAQKALEIMPRQALHARRLGFVHPISKKKIVIESKLPDDFKSLLEFLKSREYLK
jgi:23S rRNA pseudouridine1911/1915/1917 synthase